MNQNKYKPVQKLVGSSVRFGMVSPATISIPHGRSQREVLRDISTISVRSQYAVCTPFVRQFAYISTISVRSEYALCTLVCVHQCDLG